MNHCIQCSRPPREVDILYSHFKEKTEALRSVCTALGFYSLANGKIGIWSQISLLSESMITISTLILPATVPSTKLSCTPLNTWVPGVSDAQFRCWDTGLMSGYHSEVHSCNSSRKGVVYGLQIYPMYWKILVKRHKIKLNMYLRHVSITQHLLKLPRHQFKQNERGIWHQWCFKHLPTGLQCAPKSRNHWAKALPSSLHLTPREQIKLSGGRM